MFYNEIAQDYDTYYTSDLHRAEDRFVFEQLLDAMVDNVVGREQWLDVGCGTGSSLTIPLLDRGDVSLHGIDISEKMIEIAKAKARDKDLRNATFSVMDAHVLEFAEKTFNAVIAIYGSLNYCAIECIDEVHRVLKKGGSICFVLCSKDYHTRPSYIANRADVGYKPHQRTSSEAIIKRLGELGYEYSVRGLTPKSLDGEINTGRPDIYDRVAEPFYSNAHPDMCWWTIIMGRKV